MDTEIDCVITQTLVFYYMTFVKETLYFTVKHQLPKEDENKSWKYLKCSTLHGSAVEWTHCDFNGGILLLSISS